MSGWYGSLNNRIAERSKQPDPKVGDGVTECLWSDRNAYTVIEVSATGKTCKVQADVALLVGGSTMSETQMYQFAPNPNGKIVTLRLGKRGWKAAGSSSGWVIGERDQYRDPSF